jgi:hypothetical protein
VAPSDPKIESKLKASESVLELMKERNCQENMSRYRDEMAQLKYLRNPYNVTLSHSIID